MSAPHATSEVGGDRCYIACRRVRVCDTCRDQRTTAINGNVIKRVIAVVCRIELLEQASDQITLRISVTLKAAVGGEESE
jgi:hypothetical protein